MLLPILLLLGCNSSQAETQAKWPHLHCVCGCVRRHLAITLRPSWHATYLLAHPTTLGGMQALQQQGHVQKTAAAVHAAMALVVQPPAAYARALSPRQLCCCRPSPCRSCWVVRALMHPHTLTWHNLAEQLLTQPPYGGHASATAQGYVQKTADASRACSHGFSGSSRAVH